MRRVLFIAVALSLLSCQPRGPVGKAPDDVNPAYPAGCGTNSNQNAAGCSNFGTNLYTHLTHEKAAEDTERAFPNCVATTTYQGASQPNACLGATVASLTMTPSACTMYNAGIRGTETGSITFANSSTTWVAGDNCEQVPNGCNQNNPSLSNFTRVAGTHYLIDTADVTAPVMAYNSQLLMKVVTAGGSVTQVTDQRNTACSASFARGQGGFGANLFNVQNYGASGSTQTYTGTTTADGGGAGNSTVSSITTAPSDFQAGQGVLIARAGAACTLNSGATACSGVTPAAPTSVTQNGATGSTKYCYAFRYWEDDSHGVGGTTPLGNGVCITNGNATLTSVNDIGVVIPADSVAGVYQHIVYKCTGAGCGTSPSSSYLFWGLTGGTSGQTWYDNGQLAGQTGQFSGQMASGFDIPSTGDTNAYNNHYLGTIVSNNNSTLTVTPKVISAASGTKIYHEDSVAINAAIAASFAEGSSIFNPGISNGTVLPVPVYFPSHGNLGQPLFYRVTVPINDSFIAGGQVGNGCVPLLGDSGYNGNSEIIGDTGPYPILEQEGSDHCYNAYIGLTSGGEDIEPAGTGLVAGAFSNASVNGIFNNTMAMQIGLWFDPLQHCGHPATGGGNTVCVGTVAYLNIASDGSENNMDFFGSDSPMILYGFGGGPELGGTFYNIKTLYNTIGNPLGSSSATEFVGFNTFSGGGGPGILIQGTTRNLACTNCLFVNVGVVNSTGPTAPHPWAIEVGNAVTYGWGNLESFSGRVEEYSQLMAIDGGSGSGAGTYGKFSANYVHLDSVGLFEFTPSGPLIEIRADGTVNYFTNNIIQMQGNGGGGINELYAFQSDNVSTNTLCQGNLFLGGDNLVLDYSKCSITGGANGSTGGNLSLFGDAYGSVSPLFPNNSFVIEPGGVNAYGDLALGQGGPLLTTATLPFNYCGTGQSGAPDLVLSGGTNNFVNVCVQPGMDCEVIADMTTPIGKTGCYAGTPTSTATTVTRILPGGNNTPTAVATTAGKIPISCASPAGATDTVRIKCE